VRWDESVLRLFGAGIAISNAAYWKSEGSGNIRPACLPPAKAIRSPLV
jgi:hypothetical protein